MKRIADYIKTLPKMDFLTMRDKADALWRKENDGQPMPDEAWLIVQAEIESRQPIPRELAPVEYADEVALAEADGIVTESELNAMTKSALKEYAAKQGVEIGMLSTKATIIAAVKDSGKVIEAPEK